ncbi:hypothetical protein BG003_005637 [Podila horticola]|nr:hypothetical protein BG003_005637 [Podila horticola]
MPKTPTKKSSSQTPTNPPRNLNQVADSSRQWYQHAVARGFLPSSNLDDALAPTLLPARRPVDIPLLPQPSGLSKLGREGSRVVSAIINILKQRPGLWEEAEFIEAYKATYHIQYRVDAYRRLVRIHEDTPDDFPLLSSRYVRTFIKRQGRSQLKLHLDVNTDTILTDLGDDLLSDILAYTECHWYV